MGAPVRIAFFPPTVFKWLFDNCSQLFILTLLYFSTVKRTPVGAAKGPQPSSKITFIVAILVSVALFILLLIIAAILYRRRQLYDGFYICTSPPLPDLIARLDSSIPLIEQVNKLPYDKRWEFPREQLQFGESETEGISNLVPRAFSSFKMAVGETPGQGC